MHMAAASLGCKKAMVGIRLANSCPCWMNRLKKYYSHLVVNSFLVGKAAWAPIENADYYKLVTNWAG